MNEFLFDDIPFDIIQPDKDGVEEADSSAQFISGILKETAKIRVEILRLQKRLQAGISQPGSLQQTAGGIESISDPNMPKVLKYLDHLLRETRQIKPELSTVRENVENVIVKDTVKDLLPVVDAFQRVFNAMHEVENDPRTQGWLSGIQQIYSSLIRVFAQHGIEEIEAMGKMFDPKIHAAIGTVNDPTKPNGTIVRVDKQGFMKKGIPIRYPEVIVVRNQD